MALYCGIDLHSTNSWIVVLEEGHRVVLEHKARNDLKEILEVLEPFREGLVGIAVESTFNWYWLVDGLMDAGHHVHLTNTWGAKQYDGLKYTDDRHDARWLAHLLWLQILPEGYISPREDRLVRDLLRRRRFLVQQHTALLLSVQGTVQRLTGLHVPSNDIKRWTGDGLEELIEDPVPLMGIRAFLEPLRVMAGQIKLLEKEALRRARRRDEFPYLRSVWGVGPVLATTITYEAGDPQRFRSVGNFSSYCRLVESKRISNGKRKGKGNRKNGNPYLSWVFSEAGHFAVRYHEPARRFYQRKRSRTNGIVAIRASFYVMRDHVTFDPDRLFQ